MTEKIYCGFNGDERIYSVNFFFLKDDLSLIWHLFWCDAFFENELWLFLSVKLCPINKSSGQSHQFCTPLWEKKWSLVLPVITCDICKENVHFCSTFPWRKGQFKIVSSPTIYLNCMLCVEQTDTIQQMGFLLGLTHWSPGEPPPTWVRKAGNRF